MGDLGSDRFFCGRGKDTVVLEPQIFFRSDLLTLVRGADADQLSRADFKFIAIKSQSNICSGLAASDSAQLNLVTTPDADCKQYSGGFLNLTIQVSAS